MLTTLFNFLRSIVGGTTTPGECVLKVHARGEADIFISPRGEGIIQ
jgi:hypothetical protein